MARTFLIGIAAALIGGIGLMVGAALGIEFTNIVLGVGGGLILGMVRIGNPLERLAGYGIGLLLGVVFGAIQMGLIPGGASTWGAVIGVVILLLVITLVSGLTRNHIGSWSMLLGALVFISGFVTINDVTPLTANSQVVTLLLTTIVMSAIGFLVIIVVELMPATEHQKNYGHHFDEEHPKRDRPKATSGASTSPDSDNESHSTTTNLQGIVGDQK